MLLEQILLEQILLEQMLLGQMSVYQPSPCCSLLDLRWRRRMTHTGTFFSHPPDYPTGWAAATPTTPPPATPETPPVVDSLTKPEMRNWKHLTGNKKPEITNRKSHTGNNEPEISNRKHQTGNNKQEIQKRKCLNVVLLGRNYVKHRILHKGVYCKLFLP